MNKHFFALMTALFLVSGCTNTTASNSAWSTYDYKFPVPSGTGLPDSGYQNNDDNYTQPTGYGCMGDVGQVCE